MSLVAETVVEGEIVETRTLEQLAADANRYDAAAQGYGAAWAAYALRVGEALLEAQRLVPRGGWMAWVSKNLHFSYSTATRYSRLAVLRDALDGEEFLSIRAAESRLDNLGLTLPAARRLQSAQAAVNGWALKPISVERREQITALRALGHSWSAISQMLGLNRSTVRCAVDPDFRRIELERQRGRSRATKAQRKALAAQQRAEERARLVRDAPQKVSSAYAKIRTALKLLDGAIGEERNLEMRAALTTAMQHAHKAEDAIVAALQASRRS